MTLPEQARVVFRPGMELFQYHWLEVVSHRSYDHTRVHTSRVRCHEVNVWRYSAVLERKNTLDETRQTCRTLGMANIGLDLVLLANVER